MAGLEVCIGKVAPYLNLILVALLITLLFRLFKNNALGFDLRPWKFLLIGLIVFVVEELLTVFNGMGIINSPRILTPFFEMVILSSFIYMLLLQKEIIS